MTVNAKLTRIDIPQITQNDGLPDKICKECTEKAYLSFNFKSSIEQSDATLRSVLFKDPEPMKKDGVFEQGAANYLMGIKTEIAFVDADPFIDDDGDGEFDASIDYADNSNMSNQQNDSYNNNSYAQDAADEVDDDSEDEDDTDDEEMKPPKDKTAKKVLPQRILENVDYTKDEEGKYVCKICNKKLVDKKGLNLHVRLHTGENLKRCNICNRGECHGYFISFISSLKSFCF